MEEDDSSSKQIYDEALRILRETDSFEKVREMLAMRGVEQSNADVIIRLIDDQLIAERLQETNSRSGRGIVIASIVGGIIYLAIFVIGLMNGLIFFSVGLIGIGGTAIFIARRRLARPRVPTTWATRRSRR